MNQQTSAWLRESAHDFPRRILTTHAQPARFEPQAQLMNRRVSIEPWRIDANSGNGLKHQTSSAVIPRAAASAIAGFKFHMILVAAVWPRGIRRWQAETSA